MFRNNISVYCRNEEIAKQVREYAQHLNLQAGGRAIVSAEEKCKHSLQSPVEPLYTPNMSQEEILKAIKANPYAFVPQNARPQPLAQPHATPNAIPEWILDIMNGGTFPAPEDLTREERALVYDGQLNGLLNIYRISKRPETAEQIKSRLRDLGVDL